MTDISIILPTHNRAHLVGRAIDSCLSDKSIDPEIIVVDDGSTDETQAVLQNYGQKISVVNLDINHGAQHARNSGIAVATGSFMKFLDSDDVLEPGALKEEVKVAQVQEADIVVSGWAVCSKNGEQRVFQAPDFSSGESAIDDVLCGKGVFTSAAIYRTSYVREHGLNWDTDILKFQDWDWFTQAALRLGKIARYDGVSYSQLEHDMPRISNVSMLNNAINHHRILEKLGNTIDEMRLFTKERKCALAQYYYKELQVLAIHDKEHFEAGVEKINTLCPELDPRIGIKNRYLGMLASTIGTKRALQLYATLKRFI